MFLIGEKYIITRLIDGIETDSYNCIVIAYDEKNGLLKINHVKDEEIVNVRSSNFIGARIQN